MKNLNYSNSTSLHSHLHTYTIKNRKNSHHPLENPPSSTSKPYSKLLPPTAQKLPTNPTTPLPLTTYQPPSSPHPNSSRIQVVDRSKSAPFIPRTGGSTVPRKGRALSRRKSGAKERDKGPAATGGPTAAGRRAMLSEGKY